MLYNTFMLKIGELKLKTNVIMAPMSGCTDMPFRKIIRGEGCELAFYEMLDACGLTHNHKKTLSMLATFPQDKPLGAQILCNEPDLIQEAAEILLAHSRPQLIDLNFACPAPKVIRKKAGAYLLKEPKKAGAIVKQLVSCVKLPVTVKIRSGWSKQDSLEGLRLAQEAEDNGAQAVFVHGRTAAQYYSGNVNYAAIAVIKKALKVPVIGSGDIFSAELAQKMVEQTNCDGVSVARGALGQPWIFKQIQAKLKGKKVPAGASLTQIKELAKKHITIYNNWKEIPIRYYIGQMRKIAMWYFKGIRYASGIRGRISGAQSFAEIMEIIERIG